MRDTSTSFDAKFANLKEKFDDYITYFTNCLLRFLSNLFRKGRKDSFLPKSILFQSLRVLFATPSFLCRPKLPTCQFWKVVCQLLENGSIAFDFPSGTFRREGINGRGSSAAKFVHQGRYYKTHNNSNYCVDLD